MNRNNPTRHTTKTCVEAVLCFQFTTVLLVVGFLLIGAWPAMSQNGGTVEQQKRAHKFKRGNQTTGSVAEQKRANKWKKGNKVYLPDEVTIPSGCNDETGEGCTCEKDQFCQDIEEWCLYWADSSAENQAFCDSLGNTASAGDEGFGFETNQDYYGQEEEYGDVAGGDSMEAKEAPDFSSGSEAGPLEGNRPWYEKLGGMGQ